MAVRIAQNDLVQLDADETVIGVVLKREIQNGVKVRPTNVTATIHPAEHIAGGTITAANNPTTITANLNLHLLAGNNEELDIVIEFPANTFAVGDFAVTDVIEIRGLAWRQSDANATRTTAATGPAVIEAVDVPNQRLTVTIDHDTIGMNGNIFIATVSTSGNNGSIGITDETTFSGTDVILLHNGPQGGFTQQFKPADGSGDDVFYVVNSVVGGVVTNK